MRRIRRTIKGIAKIIHEIVTRTISWFGSVSLTEAIANELNYVNVFGKCEQDMLPAEYQQVEYLQSSGTQYINTWIRWPAKVRIDAQWNATTSASQIVIGTYTYPPSFRWQAGSTKKWWLDAQWTISYDTRVQAVIDFKDEATVEYNDGTSSTYPWWYDFYDSANYALFRAMNRSATSYYYANAKIFSCSFEQNWEIVADLIPARRKSDGVLWFYDKVRWSFLTNSWSGTFTAWPDINIIPIQCNNWEIKWGKKWLPTGYVPVEYIHFSGSQYFNSGLIANQDYILEFRRRRTGTWAQYLYGSSTTANNRSLTAYVPTGWQWYWRFGDTYVSKTWESDTWYTTKQDKIWVEIDWIMNEYLDTPSEFETAYSLVIWTNRSGSSATSSRLIWDIAYGKIYDWNTLVANYIACKRVSDWEYWFYDTVSQTFKTASGLTWWDIVWNIYIDWNAETIEDSLWNTATAEMLLWVTWLSDSQEILSGDITRNLGLKVFTSADIVEYQSNNRRFVLSAWASRNYGNRSTPLFCTHFQTIDDWRSLSNVPDKSIYGASTTTHLYIHYSSYTTKSSFWAWLDAQYEAWTPVVAVYPLQTPTTESVEWQTLNVRSWNNTLTITQAWIDTSKLELEVQYEALEVHY